MRKVVAMAIAVAFTLTGCEYLPRAANTGIPVTTQQVTETPNFPPKTLFEAGIDVDELDFTGVCNSYAYVLTSHMTLTNAERLLEEIPSFSSARNAADWVGENPWVRPLAGDSFEATLQDFRDIQLAIHLKAFLSESTNPYVPELDTKYRDLFKDISSEIEAQIPVKCDTETHKDLIFAVSKKANRVLLTAERVPWYPESYSAYSQNESVAYKFVSGRGCDFGLDCWNMDVITEFGCSSLYVELNILNSRNSVVGYTNDLIGNIRPSEVVEMQFSDTTSDGRTARISEISCLP